MSELTTRAHAERHYEGDLPPELTAGAVMIRALVDSGTLAKIGERVVVHRRPGYAFVDAFLFLVCFFGSGGHLGGLRGFYEDHREWAHVLGALGGRARLMSSSALSRLLSVAGDESLSAAFRWLLLEASGVLGLLREKAVMTRDAQGGEWQIFDFDPSRRAYRQRALAEADDLPPATRRLNDLAAPGHAGRKRGEVVSTEGLLQHAGSSAWLDVTVRAGNGDPRAQFASAVSAVASTVDALNHPRARAMLRADGEFGGVPSLAEAQAAGIAYLTRMVRYEVLPLPAVRARLAQARWDRVPDSGSGPARYAAELGDVLLPAGLSTRRTDGTLYEPVVARVVVSRCTHAAAGAGVPVGDEIFETFAAIGLTQEDWPATSLVEAYYGRIGQENRFCQFDRELAADTTWSTKPGGQRLALACAMFVWNARLVRGSKRAPPMPAPGPQVPRVILPGPALAPIQSSDTPGEPTPCPEDAPDTPPPCAAAQPAVLAAVGSLRDALALAGVDKAIARRKGWIWEPDTFTVVDPEGTRMPLRVVEQTRLRFQQDGRFKQAVIAISSDAASAVRAAWTPKRPPPPPRPTLRLIRPARDDIGGLATGWPTFQPAAARSLEVRALDALSVHAHLVVAMPLQVTPHPLISDADRHARHRRLSTTQRVERQAIGSGSTLDVRVSTRRRGPLVHLKHPPQTRQGP